MTSNWKFELYIAGDTDLAQRAQSRLVRICETHLHGRYSIEVLDVRAHPRVARERRIIATPLVIKTQPDPQAKVYGDLDDEERVISALGLHQR